MFYLVLWRLLIQHLRMRSVEFLEYQALWNVSRPHTNIEPGEIVTQLEFVLPRIATKWNQVPFYNSTWNHELSSTISRHCQDLYMLPPSVPCRQCGELLKGPHSDPQVLRLSVPGLQRGLFPCPVGSLPQWFHCLVLGFHTVRSNYIFCTWQWKGICVFVNL